MMQNDDSRLPLAVNSSGMGGVSPRVSMLPEAIVEHAQFLERTVKQMLPATPEEAQQLAQAMKGNLEEMAQSLDRFYGEATSTTRNLNETLLEATRNNVDKAMHFLQDMAAAKGPADAIAIQTDYMSRQFELFAKQMQDVQSAFQNLFLPLAKPAELELSKDRPSFRR